MSALKALPNVASTDEATKRQTEQALRAVSENAKKGVSKALTYEVDQEARTHGSAPTLGATPHPRPPSDPWVYPFPSP